MVLYLIFLIYVLPVLLTIVVEEVCLILLKEKKKKVYLACFLMNIVLNPIMNHTLIMGTKLRYYFPYYGTLIILEIFVIAVEAIIYIFLLKDIKKGIYYSVVLNISSFALGFVLLIAR
ncbi:MAG: hypothetical protein J6W64_11435 [Bacilli bacterium]|nr:hypothetical protein [Bacilli bacterium]